MTNYFDRIAHLQSEPQVMGILNVSEDSFYDGGKYTEEKTMANRLETMIDEGADIIDLGAYSTRPGAKEVPLEWELAQLKKAFSLVRKIAPTIPVSIDSFRSRVIQALFDLYGPFLVNDISGGTFDEALPTLAAKERLPYLIMHIQGTPANMQVNPQYQEVVTDILQFFRNQLKRFEKIGLSQVWIDPGFGFGKNIDHNYQLMTGLSEFRVFGKPILVGISRKSMIQKLLNVSAQQALNGTTALHLYALQQGASILRVHDVREAKETIQIFQKLEAAKSLKK